LEGKKNEIWEKHPKVWLSAVRKCKPTVGPKDGSFTLEYESAMAAGEVTRITDTEECISAMRALCLRFLPNHMDYFEEAINRSLHRTAVYRIDLTEIPTGKRKQYGADGEELKYGKEA
jgi:nitroimidazol reductase NimA-like FMN-containing flavoprotein (pyridoxamine 5'-phosphate oxidase superfamily)